MRRFRPVKRRTPEHDESVALCEYLETMYPERWPLIFHVPNERSSKAEAGRLKAIGVKAGVPDYVFPFARCCFHGLYLEFKPSGSTPSDVRISQSDFCEKLQREGYAAIAALGIDAAIRVIDAYMLGTREEWDHIVPIGSVIVGQARKGGV